MEQHNIDLFLMNSRDKFKNEHLGIISSQLEKVDDNKYLSISTAKYKSPLAMFFISLFFGTLGIDRFILGNVGLGIIKLLTCGGFFILWFIDLFLIVSATKKQNFYIFSQIAH